MATLNTLVTFNSTNGANPGGSLITDASGDLFGTTFGGGVNTDGTVFEISKTSTGYSSTPATLVSFDGTNGGNPYGALIADANGDLLGTTGSGGANGDGTVFEIVKSTNGYASTPTTLVSFNGADGANPYGTLLADANGDLLGTTGFGGANNLGSVFEIAKTNAGYASMPTTLVSFNGTNGARPFTGSLIADAKGDLFGMTELGGDANNDGTVFEIAKTSTGYASTPITLVRFNGSDGAQPVGSLITDAGGDLFGTTFGGGANGDGTVFEIAKTDAGYASTPATLVNFNGTNGRYPPGGLIADAGGDLFGTTSEGGANDDGTVFEIAKTSTGYASTPTTLVTFAGNSNGAFPSLDSLIADANGDLFGTTVSGSSGGSGYGTVFELTDTGFQVSPPPPTTLGNGDHTVTLSGSHNVVTIGNGNNNVSGGQDDNTVTIGNGHQSVSLSGSDNSVTLGSGNSTITVGGSNNTVKLGNGTDTVHGGTGDTIDLAATTLNLYGTAEMVFVGTKNATVNDFSTGLNLKIGPTAGKDALSNFVTDPTGVVDLIGGIGGFATTTAVLSALKSDGHGGTLLSFGGSSSLDFTDLAPSQLHVSNFQIG